MTHSQLRWRKFSPVDREAPIYELVDGDVVLMDLTRDDSGAFELALHEGAAGKVFELATLERLLAEAKALLLGECRAVDTPTVHAVVSLLVDLPEHGRP